MLNSNCSFCFVFLSIALLVLYWEPTTGQKQTATCSNGYCYTLVPITTNFSLEEPDWFASEFVCQNSFGGHLVSIHSDDENNIVKNLCKYPYISQNGGYCWIGGYQYYGGSDWIWSDGTDFNYCQDCTGNIDKKLKKLKDENGNNINIMKDSSPQIPYYCQNMFNFGGNGEWSVTACNWQMETTIGYVCKNSTAK